MHGVRELETRSSSHDHHVETFKAARYFIHLKHTKCSIADRVADADSHIQLNCFLFIDGGVIEQLTELPVDVLMLEKLQCNEMVENE